MPRSGINYAFGLEWELAAHWANYRFEDFILLPTDQQARHIAAYRCEKRIEAVVAQEQAKQARAKANAKKPTRKH